MKSDSTVSFRSSSRSLCWTAVLLGAVSAAAQQPPGWERPLPDQPHWMSNPGHIASAEHAQPVPGSRPVFGDSAEAGRIDRRTAATTARGTVSIHRLRHAPPPKAEREMWKAGRALAEGDRDEAVRRMERAIALHPNYVEAYNNLGVQYMRLSRLDDAVAAFERAAELDPASPEPRSNLACALQSLGRLDEAERNARAALDLDPRSPAANVSLASVLVERGRGLEEAVRRLRFAASTHPGARLLAADALIQLGKGAEARAELRALARGGGR